MTIFQISIAALVSALVICAEHYLPWRRLFGADLPRVAAYVLGSLAIALPLTALFLVTGQYQAAGAMWVVFASAGGTTVGCYLLDTFLDNRSRAKEAEERESYLRNGLANGQR